MTLTKHELERKMTAGIGFSRKQSQHVVAELLETIKTGLENGEDVLVSGFGKFRVKEKGQRRGRNPITGEDVSLRARRVVTFHCSKILRDKIQGESQD